MKSIIGIMGPGEKASERDVAHAHEIGRLLAQQGFVVMTGGRRSGVMEAALKGAKEANGETVAILPSKNKCDATPFADVVIVTGLNSARNFVNILTSEVVVACGTGAGTLSEIALALKEKRKVVLITDNQKAKDFLKELSPELVSIAETPDEAAELVKKTIKVI
jgi:uncharacterized protein (TIGR00725 family)